MKNKHTSAQYQSLTPQKPRLAETRPGLYHPRLSSLLISLHGLHQRTIKQDFALTEEHFNSQLTNQKQAARVKKVLAQKSHKAWQGALKAAGAASSWLSLEKAWGRASQAVSIRVRCSRTPDFIMIGQSPLEQCFQLIQTSHYTYQDVSAAIDHFQRIDPPQLEPFRLEGSSSPGVETNSFVPAPDLLQSYQETFSRANQNERIVNTTNYKLKANFSRSPPPRNESRRQMDSCLLDQPVVLENREEVILHRLKEKEIQATIPNMQQSLFEHELSHLQKKSVAVEHTLSLSEWKKMRDKLKPK